MLLLLTCASVAPFIASDRSSSLALLPDGRLLVARCDGFLVTADPATGAPREPFARHESEVMYVAVDPRGELVAASSCDGQVALWPIEMESRGGERGYPGPGALPRASLRPHPELPSGAAQLEWTHDGEYLLIWYSVRLDRPSKRSVQLWNRAGEPVWSSSRARWADASPTENLIAVLRRDEVLLVWPGDRQETLALPGAHDALAFSPDGKSLAVGGDECRFWIVDVATGEIRVERQLYDVDSFTVFLEHVARVRWSPSGRWVGVTVAEGLHPAVLDARDGSLVWASGHLGTRVGSIFDVTWTPDDRLITGCGETFAVEPATGARVYLPGGEFRAVLPTGDGPGFYYRDSAGEGVCRIDSLDRKPRWRRVELPSGRAKVVEAR